MNYIITNANIHTSTEFVENGSIVIRGHIISDILRHNESPLHTSYSGYEIIDAGGRHIIPGFIDLHCHGGGGYDVTDTTPDDIDAYINFHLHHGTTGLMLTTMSGVPIEILAEQVERLGHAMDSHESVVGVHLEGPYINKKQAGMYPPNSFRNPDTFELEQLIDTSYDTIRMITLAPELNGALELIQFCSDYGIVSAIGHTEADYNKVCQAITLGVSHVTHICNAMPQLHHREPGALGAALMDDRLSVQLICDGVHIHPLVVKMIVRLKTCMNVCLVTDAMRAAGMPHGEYRLGSFETVQYQQGYISDANGNLASTAMSMHDAFRNMLGFGDVSFNEAIQMTSTTPARVIGLQDYIGSIKAGYDADLLVMDDDLEIHHVFVKGKQIR